LDAGREAEEPPELLTDTEELAGGAAVVALAPAAGVVTPTVAEVPLEGVDEAPALAPATGVVVETFADVPPEDVETPTLAPATGVVAETPAAVPPWAFVETPTLAAPPLLPVPVDTVTVVPRGSVAETLAAGTTTGSGTETLRTEFELEPELELNSEPAAQAGGAINRPEQATARAAAPRATRSIQRPLSTYPIA
jgi:hypothetical protein